MWSYFENICSRSGTLLFITLFIVLFILTALISLALLIRSRHREIRRKRIKEGWIPVIDELLFKVVFEEAPVGSEGHDYRSMISVEPYTSLMETPSFVYVLLENTLQLHTNYSGMYSARLEAFYKDSGLFEHSLEKLKSSYWNRQCEGIRELSQMRFSSAAPLIRQFIHSKNQTLTLEAFVGVVRLEGLDGLNVLAEYTSPINDWIQLNVFFELKLTDQTDVPDFGPLLESPNETVVVFAMRLAAHYHQHKHAVKIAMIAQFTKSIRLKKEAIVTLAVFEQHHNPLQF